VSNRFRLTPRQNAMFCWVIALASIPILFGFFIGCDQLPLAGFSVGYNPDNNNNQIRTLNEYTASCNSSKTRTHNYTIFYQFSKIQFLPQPPKS
jgi:hypothetical protein